MAKHAMHGKKMPASMPKGKKHMVTLSEKWHARKADKMMGKKPKAKNIGWR